MTGIWSDSIPNSNSLRFAAVVSRLRKAGSSQRISGTAQAADTCSAEQVFNHGKEACKEGNKKAPVSTIENNLHL